MTIGELAAPPAGASTTTMRWRVLAVLQFAQAGSFSIREIRELFASSAGERAVSMRWRRLASAKLVELDALVVRVASMKRLLQKALRCGCVDVEECGRAIQRRAGRTTSPVRR